MDGIISSIKSKFAAKREQEDEQEDKNRLDDVHATLAKVDPNTMDSTMVDVEDMTSLTEVSQKAANDNPGQANDIKPTNSKTNAPSALTAATVAAFSIFKTPAERDDTEELPDPLEDDIFIYYD